MTRFHRNVQVLGATIAIAGCGAVAPTEAPAPITLLVENDSCAAGRCMTLEVRAFIWSFTIPQNPLGSRVLGVVPPGTKCIALPESLFVRILSTDQADTTILVWRPDDPAGIHLVGVDSGAFHGQLSPGQVDSINRGVYPYDGLGPSIGESARFVAAESDGWRTTFPSVPAHTGEVTHTERCALS